MNKEEQIQTIEQLIAETKTSLKTWANQIAKHHKTLKNLSNQLNSLKTQINMNQPKTQPTKSVK